MAVQHSTTMGSHTFDGQRWRTHFCTPGTCTTSIHWFRCSDMISTFGTAVAAPAVIVVAFAIDGDGRTTRETRSFLNFNVRSLRYYFLYTYIEWIIHRNTLTLTNKHFQCLNTRFDKLFCCCCCLNFSFETLNKFFSLFLAYSHFIDAISRCQPFYSLHSMCSIRRELVFFPHVLCYFDYSTLSSSPSSLSSFSQANNFGYVVQITRDRGKTKYFLGKIASIVYS